MSDQLELKVNVTTTGGESLDKLAGSTKALKEHTDKTSEAIKNFGEHIRQHIETPVGTAYVSLGRLADQFGTVGVAAGAAIAVLATMGTKAFELTEGFAKAAKEQSNFADRLGISIGQAQRFGAQAKLAGVDVGVLEASTRILATALEDSTGAGAKAYRALQQLGVATRTQSGESREMGQVMTDVLEKLSKVEDQTKRTALGAAILGRSSKEIQPLIKSFQETKEVVDAMGIGLDTAGTKKLLEFHEAVTKAEISWSLFLRSIAVKIAPIVIEILPHIGPPSFGGDTRTKGIGPNFPHLFGLDLTSQGPPPMPGGAVGFGAMGPDSSQFFDQQAGQIAASANSRNLLQNSPEFIARRIAGNKQEIGRLQDIATNPSGAGGAAVTDAMQKVAVLQQETQRLEIRLKTLEGAKTFPQEIQRFIDAMTQKDLDPVAKIFATRDDLLRKGREAGVRPTRDQADDMEVATLNAASAELAKLRRTDDIERGKRDDETHGRQVKEFEEGVLKPLAEYGQRVGLAAGSAARGIDASTFSAARAGLQQGTAFRSAQRGIAVRSGLAPAGSDVAGDLGGRIDEANALFELNKAHAQTIADLEATPALNRIKYAELEYAARKSHDLELIQINNDAELAIEDLRAKDREQARALSGGFFDAMAGGTLPGFFKSQGLGIAKTIFQNATTDMFQLPSLTHDPNSLGAKLLQGTGLGPKAVDVITVSHTAAMDRHTGALIMASGGGSVLSAGGLVPGSAFASSLPALLGGTAVGGSTAPLSFFGGSGSPGSGSTAPLSFFGGQTSNTLSALANFSKNFASGIGGGANHNLIQTLMGGGGGNGDSGGDTSGGTAAAQVGAGVALAGVAFGAASGIQQAAKGGAKNITSGIGTTAMAVAPLTGPAAPFVEAAGLALKAISSFLGDPKADRQASISHELTNAAFSSKGYIDERGNFVPGRENKSIGYFGSSTGDSYDYNFRGGLRSGSQADTSRNTFDPSPNANQPKNGAVTINVTAMDSKSFLDHASDISAAVRKGVQMGHPLIQELQATLLPS